MNNNGNNGKPLNVVGKPFRKVDARAKCTGQTKFADDIFLPRMLYCKILRSHEPRVHEYGDDPNVHKKVSLEFGEVDEGFAEADLIREDMFFYEGNTHLPMEQHAAVAYLDTDEKLTLWSSTQTPHYVHRALTKVLEIPASHIRVIATPNGGGFGGKSDPFNHEVIVCRLSMITGRPVKCTLTRGGVFYCHRGRHPVLMHVKTGVKKDGAITAMHFKSFLDGGAYGSYGVASTFYTGALQTVTYEVPRYKFEGVRVFTNKPPCGPKRGHGTPQPRYALEVHLDKIAEQLNLDPAEMRRQHLVPPNSITANYLRIGSMGLGACIDKIVAGSDWKNKFAWSETEAQASSLAIDATGTVAPQSAPRNPPH